MAANLTNNGEFGSVNLSGHAALSMIAFNHESFELVHFVRVLRNLNAA